MKYGGAIFSMLMFALSMIRVKKSSVSLSHESIATDDRETYELVKHNPQLDPCYRARQQVTQTAAKFKAIIPYVVLRENRP